MIKKNIFSAYDEINLLSLKQFNYKTNLMVSKNASDQTIKISNILLNNLQKNVSFWSNYWTPKEDIVVVSGNEKDFDWIFKTMLEFNMEKGLLERKFDEYSNSGGGGLAGKNTTTPVFWQIIGSKISEEDAADVGLSKLVGHLYAHIAQPGIINKTSAGGFLEATYYPSWLLEGQSDYHSVCLLPNNFIKNRNKFIASCYTPNYKYKEIIRSYNDKDWFKIIYNDRTFEKTKMTHEYWSGFLVYESLIIDYGIDKIIELMKNIKNNDFEKIFEDIFNEKYTSFCKRAANKLFIYSRNISL